MLLLKAKLLESRELPANEPYPPSCLVSVLAGTETLNLVGRPDLLTQLEQISEFEEVVFELRWRKVDLAALGGTGRGKAYRLSIVRLASLEEIAS